MCVMGWLGRPVKINYTNTFFTSININKIILRLKQNFSFRHFNNRKLIGSNKISHRLLNQHIKMQAHIHSAIIPST